MNWQICHGILCAWHRQGYIDRNLSIYLHCMPSPFPSMYIQYIYPLSIPQIFNLSHTRMSSHQFSSHQIHQIYEQHSIPWHPKIPYLTQIVRTIRVFRWQARLIRPHGICCQNPNGRSCTHAVTPVSTFKKTPMFQICRLSKREGMIYNVVWLCWTRLCLMQIHLTHSVV